MAEVSQEMLRAALNELEMRIMANVTTAVTAAEQRVSESLQGTVARSAASTLDSVDGAVTKALEAVKADTLARVDKAVMAELAAQALRVDGMFEEAAKSFETERLETRQLVAKLEADMSAVTEGTVTRVAATIAKFEPRLLEMDRIERRPRKCLEQLLT